MESKSMKLATKRIVAGTFGGFTMGTLLGIFNSAGTLNALSFGLFCAISGLIAGAIGHLLFAKTDHTAVVRSIFNYAIIGSVFFFSLSVVTPEVIAELLNVQGALKSMVVGLIGGAAGGATIVILFGGYSGA